MTSTRSPPATARRARRAGRAGEWRGDGMRHRGLGVDRARRDVSAARAARRPSRARRPARARTRRCPSRRAGRTAPAACSMSMGRAHLKPEGPWLGSVLQARGARIALRTRSRFVRSLTGLRTRSREDAHEPVEGELVAVGAEARDAADAGARDARAAPEGLARVGVREVDLDAGQRDGLDRVEDRDRRVRVRARVEEEAGEAGGAGLADPVDDGRPRGSVCRASTSAPSCLPRDGEARVDLGERRRCRRSRARACRGAAGSGRRCRGRGCPPPCACAYLRRARRGASARRCASGSAPCRGCRRAGSRGRGSTSSPSVRMSVIILSVPIATSCGLARLEQLGRALDRLPSTTPNSIADRRDVERRAVRPSRVALDGDPLEVHEEAGDAALGLVDDLLQRIVEHRGRGYHDRRRERTNGGMWNEECGMLELDEGRLVQRSPARIPHSAFPVPHSCIRPFLWVP